MAPSSYKVVGLLSLFYSISVVVAKPINLHHGTNESQGHGGSLTGIPKPSSIQASATGDYDRHRPLASGVWSWRHPQRPGSSPISSGHPPSVSDKAIKGSPPISSGHPPSVSNQAIKGPPPISSGHPPLVSDKAIKGPGTGLNLRARGGPPSNGKTMEDPRAVVANHQRVRAHDHTQFARKREVSTAKSLNPSVSPSGAASVTPVTHSAGQSALSSAPSVAAASSAASGTSTLKSSISSSSSSASASATAKKRGILYNSASSANAFIGKPMVSWALNWYSKPQSFSATGVEYSPSLWAPKPVFLISWQNDAKAAIAAGAKAILGFYEPDQEKGANLSATDAATAYKQHITDLFGGSAKLGSVSVSNGAGSNQGLAYLSQFMSACGACKIDFINIHWSDTYDSGTAQRFKNYVDSAWSKFQKPIWIGEFGFKSAPFPADDQENEFLKAVLPWLDQHQHVDRYAYYMASNMTSGGTLNSIGTTYATYTGS